MSNFPTVSTLSSSVSEAVAPTIAGVEVFTDDQGRFSLNAIQRAHEVLTGREQPHKAPAQWLRTKQAQEFIKEISDMQICTSPIEAKKGGLGEQGTFAHELAAVEYAGWISPAFRIKVNQTFIDYRTNKLRPSPEALDERDALLKAEIFAEVNRLIENKRFLTQRKVLRSMDVGEQLGITAREFNRTAVELGLMTAHRCGPDDTLAFLLTNEGMKYGRMASGGRRFHERGYTFTTTMWWVEDVIGYVKSFDGQRLMISIPGKPKHGRKALPMSKSAIEALNKVH